MMSVEELLEDGFVELAEPDGCGVYALVVDGEIIYIGRSENLRQRFKGEAHYAYDQLFFLASDRFWQYRIEKAMIGKYRPPLNRQLNDDTRKGQYNGCVVALEPYRFGRPRALTQEQAEEALRLLNDGVSVEEVGRRLGVSHSTILRLPIRRPGG
jgi:hypothetical protein